MTTLSADHFGLLHRGRIAPHCWADLVIFDPSTIEDKAIFSQPTEALHGPFLHRDSERFGEIVKP